MELERVDESAVGKAGDAENSIVELDLPPEYCHYRDEGCDLAESCLDCPFPNCVYEEPGGKQRWLKRIRDKDMARLYTTEGKKVRELAQMFGVSQRTVQRALKAILGNSNHMGQKNE
jgi:hypothetical protein